MKLPKDMWIVIDTLLTYDEDLLNRWYSVLLLESKITKPIRVVDVLQQLSELNLVQWGDKQRTAFRLLTFGRSYKEVQRLESRERWKERLIGFVFGIVTSGIAAALAWMINKVGVW